MGMGATLVIHDILRESRAGSAFSQQTVRDAVAEIVGPLGAPASMADRVIPIPEGPKEWVFVNFSSFGPNNGNPGLLGLAWGKRSDGQFFSVTAVCYEEPRGDDAALLERMRKAAREAAERFMTYKDCTCGIIGHAPSFNEDGSPEVDDCGEPVARPVKQYCDFHRPQSRGEK